MIDASEGRLEHIRRRYENTRHENTRYENTRYENTVRWLDFERPPGVRVSIPHQRNVGIREAKGDIIVFTDAGCRTGPGWLERLVAPLRKGEDVTAGAAQGMAGEMHYHLSADEVGETTYLREAPTLNFAFRRAAFDAVGDFDEGFAYGSDTDFSWRLNDAGYRIRLVPDAVVRHDYGTASRQRRRSFVYGKARARLYLKHRARRRRVLRDDPITVIYPLFILGLPLTLVFPPYPLLLLIPAWRNRSEGIIRVLIDHVWFGLGVLAEVAEHAGRR